MLESRFSSYVNEVMSDYEVRKLKNLANAQLSNVDKHIYDDEAEVNVVHYTDAYYNDLITNENITSNWFLLQSLKSKSSH